MPWKTMDVQEQRVRFVVAANRRGKTLAELCREFGISRPVGYEWLKRYRQGGVAAIAECSRRPLDWTPGLRQSVKLHCAVRCQSIARRG